MRIMYKLQYLPLAQQDLRNITFYISDTLKNPLAAIQLVEAFDHSISKIQEFPYAHKVYLTVEMLEKEYRILPVKNYLLFYLVNEIELEINRIVYVIRIL